MKKFTAEEKAAYKEAKTEEANAYMETMMQGVANLMNSDEYRAYLDTAAQFHRYSMHNLLMIHLQMPGASDIASFATWKKMGRYVKKGEKGIKIWAPLATKKKPEQTEEDEEKNAEKKSAKRVMRGFRLVSVFDISQTDGKDLPEIAHRLEGSAEGYAIMREAIIKSAGISVEEVKALGGANGACDTRTGEVRIVESLSELQKLKTLVHEAAHAMLHKGAKDMPTAAKELQAESTAYIVLKHFGFDSGEYTFGYIASWGTGMDPKDITEVIKPAIKAAGKLIDDIEKAAEGKEEKQAA